MKFLSVGYEVSIRDAGTAAPCAASGSGSATAIGEEIHRDRDQFFLGRAGGGHGLDRRHEVEGRGRTWPSSFHQRQRDVPDTREAAAAVYAVRAAPACQRRVPGHHNPMPRHRRTLHGTNHRWRAPPVPMATEAPRPPDGLARLPYPEAGWQPATSTGPSRALNPLVPTPAGGRARTPPAPAARAGDRSGPGQRLVSGAPMRYHSSDRALRNVEELNSASVVKDHGLGVANVADPHQPAGECRVEHRRSVPAAITTRTRTMPRHMA